MLDVTAHKNILLQILKDIYTDTTIGPVLGFKGGTAAYLFYHLGRFSVDLDFDLLDESKTDYVQNRVEKIVSEYGAIRDAHKKRNTILIVLSYEDRTHNIKVEINLKNAGAIYEIKSYLGISMKVMTREDMFANKLVAMVERIGKTNRDIYDVWFFLKHNWPINRDIVERRTGMKFEEFTNKCIADLENMSDRGILAGMGELLDPKQKAWAKGNLRKDAIFLLKMKLGKS